MKKKRSLQKKVIIRQQVPQNVACLRSKKTEKKFPHVELRLLAAGATNFKRPDISVFFFFHFQLTCFILLNYE